MENRASDVAPAGNTQEHVFSIAVVRGSQNLPCRVCGEGEVACIIQKPTPVEPPFFGVVRRIFWLKPELSGPHQQRYGSTFCLGRDWRWGRKVLN